MENPLKRLFEKPRRRIDSLELSDEEMSQLMLDVDKVWMSDDRPDWGYDLIESLKQLSEPGAAQVLSSLLVPYLSLDLEDRLGSVGIAVGELTPNNSTPSGVRGMLRSGTPILLTTRNSPEDFHRPMEIARAIGQMIYGRNDDAVRKFVEAFSKKGALSEFTHPDAVE